MPITDADRLVVETRDLLAQHGDRKMVVRVLRTRGMDEAEAAEFVKRIYKQNLWENRKSALGIALAGGAGVLVFGAILIFAHRLFLLWLPLSALTCGWGIIKCLTCSGYEIENDD